MGEENLCLALLPERMKQKLLLLPDSLSEAANIEGDREDAIKQESFVEHLTPS